MSRPSCSPRSRIIPPTTASPVVSPTGAPCTKSCSPMETHQATAVLSRLTSRNKVRSTNDTPAMEPVTPDYFSRKPGGYSRSNTGMGLQEVKTPVYASAYVSFPEFDQYQRRDAITTGGQ